MSTIKTEVPLYDKRVEVIVDLLDKVTSRSRILQRAMAAFYYGLGLFILTSVTIAVAGFFNSLSLAADPGRSRRHHVSLLRQHADATGNTDGDRDRQCRDGFYLGARPRGRAERNRKQILTVRANTKDEPGTDLKRKDEPEISKTPGGRMSCKSVS